VHHRNTNALKELNCYQKKISKTKFYYTYLHNDVINTNESEFFFIKTYNDHYFTCNQIILQKLVLIDFSVIDLTNQHILIAIVRNKLRIILPAL